MNAQVQAISKSPAHFLPLDSVNDANALISKMTAVADLLQAADSDEFTRDTIPSTAWLIRDMLQDLHAIVNSRV